MRRLLAVLPQFLEPFSENQIAEGSTWHVFVICRSNDR